MSPVALFDHSRVVGLLSSSREVRTGQKSNFAIVNFFYECAGPNFYQLLYDSKTGFRSIFGHFRDGVFAKNPLLLTVISASNDYFWPSEGLFLAKNLENKVFFQFIQSKNSQFET